MTSPPAPVDDDEPIDPRAGLDIVAAQRRRVRDSDVDGRVLFGIWGVAWLLGYLVQWWSASQSPTGTSTAPAGAVFGALMFAGVVLTIVHVARRSRGVRGTSQVVGAMYGWAWFLGFVAQGTIVAGAINADAPPQVVAVVANGAACLVVGLLYMAGGALWREPPFYALGAWLLVTAAAASLVGMPAGYLVMALAGGGGMTAAAVATVVHRWRHP